MKLKNWLQKWNLSSLKINAQILEFEINFSDTDKKAAWEMYIELLTRVTTQNLKIDEGDENAALESIYKLFNITREILKKYGSTCVEFTKIAVVVLNQVIRPFTAKWHKKSIENIFSNKAECKIFREELEKLQVEIRNYTKALSDIAGVEDLTELEINKLI